MKNLLFILLLLASCSKSNDTTPARLTNTGCHIDMAMVKDFQWHPVNTALAELTFASDSTYYENTTNDGTWVLSNGCDSIHVTRSVNNFYYRINSVTADTLKLSNPVFGELNYYR